jgi:hypothetical protein
VMGALPTDPDRIVPVVHRHRLACDGSASSAVSFYRCPRCGCFTKFSDRCSRCGRGMEGDRKS